MSRSVLIEPLTIIVTQPNNQCKDGARNNG